MAQAQQRSAISRTLASSSASECLGLTAVTAPTRAAVRKAYKGLAILLHPDKNPLPDAERAFKKLGAAFRTLIAEAVDPVPAAPEPVAPAAPADVPAAQPPPPAEAQDVGQGIRRRGRAAVERSFHAKIAPAPTARPPGPRRGASSQPQPPAEESGDAESDGESGSESVSESEESSEVALHFADDERGAGAGSGEGATGQPAELRGRRGEPKRKRSAAPGQPKAAKPCGKKRRRQGGGGTRERRRRPRDVESDEGDEAGGGRADWSRGDDPDYGVSRRVVWSGVGCGGWARAVRWVGEGGG